ncbi:MAG TPA: EAL domain-containing protein, partial [Acidimicrobiales bacterium]|nr:EAL domain-containing protein [Acidimicrobiales bacterium]
SAARTVESVLPARACRIVGTAGAEAGSTSEAAGPGTPGLIPAHGVGTSPATFRAPVGDPRDPLGFVEVDTDRPTTSEDEQFVESVAGIVLATVVRFRAEDAIRHQAMHDPLTGLPNRALFNDRLEHALSKRRRVAGHVAVMIVDLDGFKNVNDSLGHLAGDALLVAVARRFGDSLRGFDTIARLGGDEFAILFDGLDATEQAGPIAQRVLDALVRPLPLPEREVAIGASVGIALTDRSDVDAGRLLADADAAMYRAKREGKGCYRVFEASMHTAAVERMNLEQELRTAIRDHALGVHFQPIVDAITGAVVSFEALARWEHPSGMAVPPAVFIPLAEESGLIVDLGRAVLVEACRQARRWRDAFPAATPRVSVNASRLQLASASFPGHVADALSMAGLDPTSLVVEVTESILASESGTIIANLDELRRAGAKVAIDDFGTGYSSFAALAELPIDILKIDKRFIDNLVFDDQGRGFVTAIMQLAHTLRLETTAEGVESGEQRSALAAMGCTHLQGYFFARPMPGEETLGYLARPAVTVAGAAPGPLAEQARIA